MRLEIKFHETATPAQREAAVEQVRSFGAETVEPLFAGEQDAELASLYAAEGVPDAQADDIVSSIGALDAVEFAEKTASRRAL